MKIVFMALACSLLLGACTNGIDNSTSYVMPSSMKAENISSKTYELDAQSETLLQDPSGKLIYVPKDAFEDENGNPVSGDVTLEFTVLTDLSQTLLAGITGKTSDGKLLSQEAVFRINASQKGKQLRIRKGSTLSYFGEAENELYSGEFDAEKKFSWNKKIEPEKYLSTVPLSELNFCMEGVDSIIKRYLPFRGYKEYTSGLRDSLYYSISARFSGFSIKRDDMLHIASDSFIPHCGIDPAYIKSLKNLKFENTLIATKAFEERVALIHKTTRRELLDVYSGNLDEYLWKLDSAAALLAPKEFKMDFQKLSAQKLGRVEKRISSEKAKAFLEKEKDRLKKEITTLEKKYQEDHQLDKRELHKLEAIYSKMLTKRHEYRLSKLGWYDEGILIPEGIYEYTFNTGAIQGKFDRMYAYLVLPEIKSLFTLEVNAEDNTFTFSPEDNFFAYRKGMKIWAITVCYKGDSLYYDKLEFIGTNNLIVNLTPRLISAAELTSALQYERNYKYFNKIEEDMAIREKILAKENKIKEHERIERMVLELYWLVTKCPECESCVKEGEF